MARPEPDCIWRMKKIHTAMSSSIGNQLSSMLMIEGTSSSEGRARNFTSFFSNRSTSVGSLGGA